MKKFKYFLTISMLFLSSAFAADVVHPSTPDLPRITSQPTAKPGNEIVFLDQLISITEQNVENQKELKEKVKEYIQLRDQYARQTQNQELGMRLVRAAYEVLEGIKEQHLTHVFDKEFMSELTFFSTIGAKQKGVK